MQTIDPFHLALAAIPALFVVFILWRWSAGARHGLAALARMLVQLLLIGYVLVYIFEADAPWIVLVVMSVMCMCMVFGASGLSAALFLTLLRQLALGGQLAQR